MRGRLSAGRAVPARRDGYRTQTCASRRMGTSGLSVSRLALGTMTWGRTTDRGRRPRPAAHLPRRRRDAGRHRARLLRRRRPRRSSAASSTTSVDRDDLVICTKAGHLPPLGQARRRHLAAQPAQPARHLAASGSAPTTSTSGWSTPGSDEAPLDRDAVGAWSGRSTPGRARYVGVSNYRAGRRRARCRCSSRRGSRWWPTRSSTPWSTAPPSTSCSARRRRSASACSPGHRSGAACSPASTATASRPTPGRPRATSPGFTGPLPRRPQHRHRRGAGHRRQGPGGQPRRGGAGLGARPAGRGQPRRRRPHHGPAAHLAGQRGRSSCPRSWSRPWTRSPPERPGLPSSAGVVPESLASTLPVVVLVDVVDSVVVQSPCVVVVARRRRPRRRRSSILVVLVVTVVDVERGHLAVGLQEGVVVGVEGVGEVLVGRDDRRVVLAALGGRASRCRSKAATRWPARHAGRRSCADRSGFWGTMAHDG